MNRIFRCDYVIMCEVPVPQEFVLVKRRIRGHVGPSGAQSQNPATIVRERSASFVLVMAEIETS